MIKLFIKISALSSLIFGVTMIVGVVILNGMGVNSYYGKKAVEIGTITFSICGTFALIQTILAALGLIKKMIVMLKYHAFLHIIGTIIYFCLFVTQVCDYDRNKIERIRAALEMEDGKYHQGNYNQMQAFCIAIFIWYILNLILLIVFLVTSNKEQVLYNIKRQEQSYVSNNTQQALVTQRTDIENHGINRSDSEFSMSSSDRKPTMHLEKSQFESFSVQQKEDSDFQKTSFVEVKQTSQYSNSSSMHESMKGNQIEKLGSQVQNLNRADSESHSKFSDISNVTANIDLSQQKHKEDELEIQQEIQRQQQEQNNGKKQYMGGVFNDDDSSSSSSSSEDEEEKEAKKEFESYSKEVQNDIMAKHRDSLRDSNVPDHLTQSQAQGMNFYSELVKFYKSQKSEDFSKKSSQQFEKKLVIEKIEHQKEIVQTIECTPRGGEYVVKEEIKSDKIVAQEIIGEVDQKEKRKLSSSSSSSSSSSQSSEQGDKKKENKHIKVSEEEIQQLEIKQAKSINMGPAFTESQVIDEKQNKAQYLVEKSMIRVENQESKKQEDWIEQQQKIVIEEEQKLEDQIDEIEQEQIKIQSQIEDVEYNEQEQEQEYDNEEQLNQEQKEQEQLEHDREIQQLETQLLGEGDLEQIQDVQLDEQEQVRKSSSSSSSSPSSSSSSKSSNNSDKN